MNMKAFLLTFFGGLAIWGLVIHTCGRAEVAMSIDQNNVIIDPCEYIKIEGTYATTSIDPNAWVTAAQTISIFTNGVDLVFESVPDANSNPMTTVRYEITDDSIRKLAVSGAICEVLGHNWRIGKLHEDGLMWTEGPPTAYRFCSLCGKEQSRRTDNWE